MFIITVILQPHTHFTITTTTTTITFLISTYYRSLNCLEEVSAIAAMLSVENVWYSLPHRHLPQQGGYDKATSSSSSSHTNTPHTLAHSQFYSPLGDHLTLLNVFQAFDKYCGNNRRNKNDSNYVGKNEKYSGYDNNPQNERQWCEKNFLRCRALRMARNIRYAILFLLFILLFMMMIVGYIYPYKKLQQKNLQNLDSDYNLNNTIYDIFSQPIHYVFTLYCFYRCRNQLVDEMKKIKKSTGIHESKLVSNTSTTHNVNQNKGNITQRVIEALSWGLLNNVARRSHNSVSMFYSVPLPILSSSSSSTSNSSSSNATESSSSLTSIEDSSQLLFVHPQSVLSGTLSTPSTAAISAGWSSPPEYVIYQQLSLGARSYMQNVSWVRVLYNILFICHVYKLIKF